MNAKPQTKMNSQTEYKGYTITGDTVETRFGTLHRAWVANGEPFTGPIPAYNTKAKAVAAAKRTVDFWEA